MKKLLLRRDIYSLESINKAIDSYTGFAEFDISDDGDYISIVFNNCRYDEQRTMKEFENYLIGMENT